MILYVPIYSVMPYAECKDRVLERYKMPHRCHGMSSEVMQITA